MQSLPKLAWSLVGTALFLGLIYFIFQDNRVLNLVFPDSVFGSEIKATVENVREKIFNVVDPVMTPIVNQGRTIVENVYEAIQGKVETLIDDTKASAIDSVKNLVNEKIDNVAEEVGIKKKPLGPC